MVLRERGHRVVGRALFAAVFVASTIGVVGIAAPASAAGVCGPPVTSVIACENTQPGDPRSDWQVTGAGDDALQGFATSMSSKLGDTVSFKVSSTTSAYHVDILRMGYYQGNGARKVATLAGPFPRNSQPSCTDSSTGLIDCGNWSVSLTWTVPTTAVSGIYVAHLVRNDNGGSSLVPFVVRDEASHSDIVVQASDTTWQAYNAFGGNSLYTCSGACPPGTPLGYRGASKVSYNRPFHSGADDDGRSWLTYAELPMISFLEANGYDVSYLSGGDVDRAGSLLLNHKVFVSSGHDEYWSGDQRANVEAARDQGVDLAFFSGNEAFWKTRWEADERGNPAHPRGLQGHPLRRADRPGVVDGHLAGPPLPHGPARERPDRPVLRRELGHHRHQGARAVRRAPALAQHGRRVIGRGPVADPRRRERHARLRVGRGARQRLQTRRACSTSPPRRRRPQRCSRTTDR